jgi:tRNA nucleotidyltransferase/poly(A) polymerase
MRNPFVRSEIFQYIRQIAAPLWLCGGSARDLALDRAPLDIDLLTPDKALDLAAGLAAAIKGKYVALH